MYICIYIYMYNNICWICTSWALGPRGPGLGPGRRFASELVDNLWSISDGPYIVDYIFCDSVKIDHAEIDNI